MAGSANLTILIEARDQASAELAKLNSALRSAGSTTKITATNAGELMKELRGATTAQREVDKLDRYIKQLGGSADGSKGRLAGMWSGFQSAAGSMNLGGLGGLAAVSGVAGAAALGVSKLVGSAVEAAGSLQRLGEEVDRFQDETGASAEAASGLLAVLKRYDVSSDAASRSLGIFSKGLRGVFDEENGGAAAAGAFSNAIQSLGVTTTDAAGNLLPMDQLLFAIADKFKAMPDGVVKTADAMALFGRSGKDMLDFLQEGGAALKEQMETAKRYGVVLDQDTVDSVRKLTLAQKDLDAATSGLGVRFGQLIMPIQTGVVNALLAAGDAIRFLGDNAISLNPQIALTAELAQHLGVYAGGATPGIQGMADAMYSADAGARNMAAGLSVAGSAIADASRLGVGLLPDQLAAQVTQINLLSGATKKLTDEKAAAAGLGVGRLPDQIEAQVKAQGDYIVAIGAVNVAKDKEAEASKALAAANKAESDANAAASAAESAANKAAAAIQEGIRNSAQAATEAVTGLQKAMDGLANTPVLGSGAMAEKQGNLQDQIAASKYAIDQMQRGMVPRSGMGAERRNLSKLEKDLASASLEEGATLNPLRRQIASAAKPELPELPGQSILDRIANLRPSLLAAQSVQNQTNSVTNHISVTVGDTGRATITGTSTDEGIGQKIAGAIANALDDLFSGGTSGQGAANPQLAGAP